MATSKKTSGSTTRRGPAATKRKAAGTTRKAGGTATRTAGGTTRTTAGTSRKAAGTKRKTAPTRTGGKVAKTTAKAGRGVTATRPAKRTVTKPANKWFELRRSAIQGQGGFAIRDIPRGTKIVEYTGERISQDEADRRYDDEKMKRHHTFLFTLDDGTCIDAARGGNEARFINHSCDPNAEAVIEGKRIFIYAKRRIPQGQELLYDYQYEYQDDYTRADERFYACRCGSAKCRGTILLPKKKRQASRPRAAR